MFTAVLLFSIIVVVSYMTLNNLVMLSNKENKRTLYPNSFVFISVSEIFLCGFQVVDFVFLFTFLAISKL
jgi:hypothetical protein